jgi:tetratricopeptide (TPR) repeat protein
MYSKAISHLKKAIDLSNGRLVIIAALGAVYAKAGMIEDALIIKEELRKLQSEKEVSPYYFAVIDAPLGNSKAAIDSLYRAYDEHFGILVYLAASPMLDDLIGEERFDDLLKKIGLE